MVAHIRYSHPRLAETLHFEAFRAPARGGARFSRRAPGARPLDLLDTRALAH
jgi:hypothetical protein